MEQVNSLSNSEFKNKLFGICMDLSIYSDKLVKFLKDNEELSTNLEQKNINQLNVDVCTFNYRIKDFVNHLFII